MTETTTVVVAVGLLAGAVYLATRKEKILPPGDDDDDSLCSTIGGVNKTAGIGCALGLPVLGKVADALFGPSECVKQGGTWGYWKPDNGFLGLCYPKKTSGTVADVGTRDVPKPSSSVNAIPSVASSGLRTVCCKPDGRGLNGIDTKCTDRRPEGFGSLSRACKGPWAGEQVNVGGKPEIDRDAYTVELRDHR